MNIKSYIMPTYGVRSLEFSHGKGIYLFTYDNKKYLDFGVRRLFSLRVPAIISDFTEISNARDSGLEKGDIILSINNAQTKYFDQLNHK